MTAKHRSAREERLSGLVKKAVESDECGTHRIRDCGCFKEVRVSEEPGFGLRVEVDIEVGDATCDQMLPSNLEQSHVGEEALEMLNAGEDVTGFEEAIPEDSLEMLVTNLASGSDASSDAIRQSIRELGYCSEVYQSPDGSGVAVFSAFF